MKMTVLLNAVFCVLCSQASGYPFAGGDGTRDNPYRITTARQLLDIGSNAQLLDKCFVLENDVDLRDCYGVAGYLTSAPIAPSGNGSGFEGWLDGQGHTVRSLCMKWPAWHKVGLFGVIGPRGVVMSLHIKDASVDSQGERVGLLAGSSSGTLIGCSVQGQVKGALAVGLLVGEQQGGTIVYCQSEGVISGEQAVGGLIGRMADGEVLGCGSDCRLGVLEKAFYDYGGLIGRVVQGTVEDSFARTELVATMASNVGGAIGRNEKGVIRTCLSLGKVGGNHTVGGLVGSNGGMIRSCYSLCGVEAKLFGGGLVCTNQGTVMLCYAAGPVKAQLAGGLIQQGQGAFLSHWDTQKSGVQASSGGFGRNTAQMQQARTFRGWGYDGEWILPYGDTPRLWWEPRSGTPLVDTAVVFSGGSGSRDDPYKIGKATELAALAWNAGLLDKHFILTQDISLASLGANDILPIGVMGLPFCGSLDGQGHAVSGFACDLPIHDVGLFGCVGASLDDPNRTGLVKNLVLRGIQVSGREAVGCLAGCLAGGRVQGCLVVGQVHGFSGVGGVVGEVLRGEVTNTAFEGSVTGDTALGGLAGFCLGSIQSCYAAGSVTGESWAVAGLVGRMGATPAGVAGPLMAFCYCEAEVKGGSGVGGLIGSAEYGEVYACYAAGKVQGRLTTGGVAGTARGMVTWGNVWDREGTGVSTSAFGRSATTSEMMDLKTFAGWEYGGQWTIKAGDRPRLVWEDRAGPLLVNPPRTYGGGSGTRADPYLISEAGHLVTLSCHPQDFSKHFRMVKDIDLTPVQADLVPIGTLMAPFTGSFDGNCHTLMNLKYTDAKASYVGLFRSIRRSAAGPEETLSGLVTNLNLDGVQVTAELYTGGLAAFNDGQILFCTVAGITAADGYAGGLVGHNGRDGVLLACESKAGVTLGGATKVEGFFECAGGLVAYNEGDLVLCSSSGQVRGSRDAPTAVKPQRMSYKAGGLVGINRGGSLTGCTSTSGVSARGCVAGLVAENIGGRLYRCGVVTDADGIEGAGGLVGTSTGGIISGCRASGRVAGNQLGGLIEASTDDGVEACYFNGTLTGFYIGGLICTGYGLSKISDCYCVARIEGVPNAGAFARSFSSSVQVSGCFWDKTVFAENRNIQEVSTEQASRIKGLDTETLQACQDLRDSGWDFTGTWIQRKADYPRLWWEN